MNDPRLKKLAHLLIDHSCQLQAGEHVLIEAIDLPSTKLVEELIQKARQCGAHPYTNIRSQSIERCWIDSADPQAMQNAAQWGLAQMKQMDAYIGIRGASNSAELSDVDPAQTAAWQQHFVQPVHFEQRVPHTKWVVLRYPTPSFAQAAEMSTEAFEDFYFNVCTLDYSEMERRQEALVQRMENAKQVHIKSPGTDLTFSIEGIPVVACNGRRNIPDGEVFTAPVKDSVNGTIQYNTGSRYRGTVFQNIRFRFENGKIVEAEAGDQTTALNAILDSDEGARYIGEWSLGCNPRITNPMLDTLFDEKIGGSLHLTPGNAYTTADNSNRSQVHWDLVLIQTPAYGGGEVWFDGELIRKDGEFLPEDLQPLNSI